MTAKERREENINNLKSFREWKEIANEQQRIVDGIMEQLESNPHRWNINFEQLNNDLSNLDLLLGANKLFNIDEKKLGGSSDFIVSNYLNSLRFC